MDNFYVYMYLRGNNSVNGSSGSPYYIGKGHGKRAFTKRGNVPLPKDRSRIVIAVDGLSEQAANAEEKRLIAFYGRIDKQTGCLRNRTDGGEGVCGAIWSREVIEKRAAAMRGRKQSPEVVSQKRLRRISEAHKSILRTRNLGKKMSIEARQKMSASHSMLRLSESHKAKISATLLGMRKSPEHVEKIRQAKLRYYRELRESAQ